MAPVPAAIPDSETIRELIRKRGHSQAGFARKISRPPRSLYHVLNDKPPQPISIEYAWQIARGLYVKPGDISDWTADDGYWEYPVRPIPGEPQPEDTAA